MKPVVAPQEQQPDGFAFTKANMKIVHDVIARYPKGRQKSAIMPLLDLVQRQMAEEGARPGKGENPYGGWIPTVAMDEIARILDVAPMKVYEVATFYTMYNLRPVGKYHIQCCTTTPCWLRGSNDIVKTCEKKLGIKMGQTTKDGMFTLTEVECLGACVNAPMVQINDDYYEDLSSDIMAGLIDDLTGDKVPEKGSQTGRRTSMSAAGPTTLEKEARKAKVI